MFSATVLLLPPRAGGSVRLYSKYSFLSRPVHRESWRNYSYLLRHRATPATRCQPQPSSLASSYQRLRYYRTLARCSLSFNAIPASGNFDAGSSASLYRLEKRYFRCTPQLSAEKDEAKSKVEKMLQVLREELEARESERKEIQAATEASILQKKKSIWQKVIDECKHYYHGFKLLFTDARISFRFLRQVLSGHTLSRKERRQLVRTVSDLFRLVPFLVFVIVPFMEFTLPIFLKLFPNMLPSTFQEQSKEIEKARKQLKVKLEMAKFLQATMEEMSLESKKSDGTKVAEFSAFLKKIREGEGGYVSNSELLKFSKLFEDELTLDNLSHAQLRALCRIVGIQPIGTSNMLRFQLNMKLRELKADDKLIAAEGVDTMSIIELQQACRARGMRSLGLSEQRLKAQLNQWLELSLSEKVPPSLLLLSSTLYLPEEVNISDRLTTLLKTLPTQMSEEVRLKLSDLEGSKIDNKARLELIKSIEAALKVERDEELRLQKLEEQKRVAEQQEPKPAPTPETLLAQREELIDKAKAIVDDGTITKLKKTDFDVNELEEIEELLSHTARGKLSEEKEDLQELKRDVEEHKADVEQVKSIMVLKGEQLRESKAAKRLQSQVNRMISKADTLIDKLHIEKEVLQEEIGQSDETEAKKKDIVFINDMLLSLRRLQKLPDDTKLERVVDVLNALDEDHDGAIDVNLALQVIDLLGQDNVKISPEQMQRICALLKKENLVDELHQMQQQAVMQQMRREPPETPITPVTPETPETPITPETPVKPGEADKDETEKSRAAR